MTNEEYFIRWAKEYEDTVDALTERIDRLREEKKKAKLSELITLNDRIRILTAMKSDCNDTMKALLRKAAESRKAVQTWV